MRTVMDLAALLVALPQLVLCAAFLRLEHVSGGTLGSLMSHAFALLLALLSWNGLRLIVLDRSARARITEKVSSSHKNPASVSF